MLHLPMLMLVLLISPLSEQEPIVSVKTLKSLDNAAQQLARGGQQEAMMRLLALLESMGYEARALEKLEGKCAKTLDRAKKDDRCRGRIAKRLAKTAKTMASRLKDMGGEDRLTLAEMILKIDSEQDEAHLALGHVLEDHIWALPELHQRRKRRGTINETLQKARRLTFEIEAGESDMSFFQELIGGPGSKVRFNQITLHSTLGPDRLHLILTDVLRALALSNYLRTGTLALPRCKMPLAMEFVFVDTEERYRAAVDHHVRTGRFTKSEAEEAKVMDAVFSQNFYLSNDSTEANAKSTLLNYIADTYIVPPNKMELWSCLYAGHLNWICLNLFGTSVPNISWYEVIPGGGGSQEHQYAKSGDDTRDLERKALLRLTESSLLGCRAWLQGLVEKGEDPPFEKILAIEEFGRVKGVNLLKSTLVADYLQERGDLARLMAVPVGSLEEPSENSEGRTREPPTPGARFSARLGKPVADFDARWRRWILPERNGLVQRLGANPGGPEPTCEEQGLLAYLDSLRKSCWDEDYLDPYLPLKIEPALSRGALLHARYLDLHPDQAAAWPDAHEEYTDRKGFTPEGCLAGLHSVIVPGDYAKHPEDAVDAWMGTFYHRLPIIRPGLVRVGWGATKGTAVLDTSTLVQPDYRYFNIRWPHDGMKDVPLRFEPELPNPVPGEDQSHWGYPITLQRYMPGGEARMELHLYEGSRVDAKHEVPCHFSTPSKPTNPELKPKGAYCLIPKSSLKASCRYTVKAEDPFLGESITWSFTTGK